VLCEIITEPEGTPSAVDLKCLFVGYPAFPGRLHEGKAEDPHPIVLALGDKPRIQPTRSRLAIPTDTPTSLQTKPHE
jgi:hypothetical protein